MGSQVCEGQVSCFHVGQNCEGSTVGQIIKRLKGKLPKNIKIKLVEIT